MKKTTKHGIVLEDTAQYKILNKGRQSASNAELLATIIASGNHAKDLQKAQLILSENYQSLNEIGKLSALQIQSFGITANKSAQILAAIEIGRRRNLEDAQRKITIKSSREIFELVYPNLSDLEIENFVVIFLNKGNKVIKIETISEGGLSGTVVDIKVICKKCIETLSSAVIFAHNHPSGNLRPSDADISITKKMKEALKLFEIQVLDHVIIGDKNYYSFADDGII